MSNELNEQIEQLQQKIEYYKSIVSEMTVPLIDSVLPDTLLMPLNGHLFKERFIAIDKKLFKHLESSPQTKILIIDFTGITSSNLEYISAQDLSATLERFNKTMKLLGIRTIYTGFQTKVVFDLVLSGFPEKLETYATYRMAINQVANEKNIYYSLDE